MTETTTTFEWSEDYNTILSKIAQSEQVETEWPKLRDILTHKIEKNVSMYLEIPPPNPLHPPTSFSGHPTSTGGLKLPPFPQRAKATTPINYMNAEQANEAKSFVLSQLNEFESTPFTIQRVCELCVAPQKHYKSVGKYLRALEKSLLVTSTLDAFPELTADKIIPAGGSTLVAASTPMSSKSVPMELFSPISFLHDDARRSKSNSPAPVSMPELQSLKAEQVGLGLVDELDSPAPGHMSEIPVALTSTTTLEDRFVKSEEVGIKPEEGSIEPEEQGGKSEGSNTKEVAIKPDETSTKLDPSSTETTPAVDAMVTDDAIGESTTTI